MKSARRRLTILHSGCAGLAYRQLIRPIDATSYCGSIAKMTLEAGEMPRKNKVRK